MYVQTYAYEEEHKDMLDVRQIEYIWHYFIIVLYLQKILDRLRFIVANIKEM